MKGKAFASFQKKTDGSSTDWFFVALGSDISILYTNCRMFARRRFLFLLQKKSSYVGIISLSMCRMAMPLRTSPTHDAKYGTKKAS
jgi:hypothetical protein